uniref:Putative structural protein n=1 Tax=viral metagenome TaxID=1070528 RepID=A0A6M3KNC0_9ZZZZ
MANAIATQVIEDGNRDTIIKWTIVGDGSGDETKTIIFDASAYKIASIDNKLWKIQISTVGASAILYWDATTDIPLISLPADHPQEFDFSEYGGIPNNGGAGRTGDILITTSGLGAGEHMTIILYVKERSVPIAR